MKIKCFRLRLRVSPLLTSQARYGAHSDFQSSCGAWYVCLHVAPWFVECYRLRPGRY